MCNCFFQYGRRILFKCCRHLLEGIRTEYAFELGCWNLEIIMWGILIGFGSQWYWKDWKLFWYCFCVLCDCLVTLGLHFLDLANGIKHVLQYDAKTMLYNWRFCHGLYFVFYVLHIVLLCSNVYDFYGGNIVCCRISHFYCNFDLFTVEVEGTCIKEIMLIRVFCVISVHCFKLRYTAA
jgi:hypothetical protein